MSLRLLFNQGKNAAAAGDTLSTAVSLVDGAVAGAAAASGATLTVAASVIGGAISGSAIVSGTTLTVTVSTIAGAATGGAQANGAAVVPHMIIMGADVSGDADAFGDLMAVAIALDGGAASGGAIDGNAIGDLLTVSVALTDGLAVGIVQIAASPRTSGAQRTSQRRRQRQHVEHGQASGAIVGIGVLFTAGTAAGSAKAIGGELLASKMVILSGEATFIFDRALLDDDLIMLAA